MLPLEDLASGGFSNPELSSNACFRVAKPRLVSPCPRLEYLRLNGDCSRTTTSGATYRHPADEAAPSQWFHFLSSSSRRCLCGTSPNMAHLLTPRKNRIKAQAHDHPRFRAFAAKYGQSIHQLNMKLSVALLRDPDAERRAKERAEAPTVKTEEQHKREEASKDKVKPDRSSSSSSSSSTRNKFAFQNVWRRKFRPLPEAKAVDLFADVIGDGFILGVAGGLIIYEYWKASQKPDINKERIDDLDRRFDELKHREDELANAEEKQRQRFDSLEEALRALQDPKTKQPLLPTLQARLAIKRIARAAHWLQEMDIEEKEPANGKPRRISNAPLETHDVAFPVPSHRGRGQLCRVVLLSASQVGTPEARDRIDRLSLLDGGGKVAVILLLADRDGMAAFMTLQVEVFANDGIPIVPISSAVELPSCLDSLRRQCTGDGPKNKQAEETSTRRDLASYCVKGQPLSESQTNVLSDICGGFGDLAQHAFNPEGQRKICDFLGDEDGHRVISFFMLITRSRVEETVFSPLHNSVAAASLTRRWSIALAAPTDFDNLHQRRTPTAMPSQSSDKRRRSRTSPRIVQRQQEFQELCHIFYSIEAMKKMPTIPDSQLEDFRVIRGAPFDIDSDDPIDFDPRFFLPGSADKMEEGFRREPRYWRIFPPLDYKKLRSSEWRDHMGFSDDCSRDARCRHLFFENATRDTTDWAWH
ncbi:hypothetical protein TOPH_06654 [Tolypocladium ophioglossoides CBS 100239]|uniref:OPA3-like protein n=1 Tax=Tolypocladium ophioglossoides (strain CBS 100239) TaxID=1163406 RepID=A0A0L0N3S6_TOLOC|nr:hypothetical protein TOPH_06654 [Tolypocladium ophioglossoides CBS 100239]